MSHDKNGTQLEAGDIVTVEFRVTGVFPNADPNFCNCNLESVIPMPGNNIPTTLSAISTKQVLLVAKQEV